MALWEIIKKSKKIFSSVQNKQILPTEIVKRLRESYIERFQENTVINIQRGHNHKSIEET